MFFIELSKPNKKKRYSLDLKTDDKKFRPENFEDELLRPVVTGKFKKNEFDDVSIVRKN